MTRQIVLGISGASGAAYAQRLAGHLVRLDAHVHLVATPPARRVIADELGIRRLDAESFLGEESDRMTIYPAQDIGARIASGSFRTHGMVICPASAHTAAAVAHGLADNLLTRAAMVTLKESRRLIVVPREIPLGPIELENLLKLSRAGVIVCPASPGFYTRPQSIEDLLDFVCARVLDLLGFDHTVGSRWNPDSSEPGDFGGAGGGS